MFLLLVYDYKREIFKRSKYRGARSEHNVAVSAFDFPVRVKAFTARKRRMYYGKSFSETRGKHGDRLPRQRNFGHKDDSGFTAFYNVLAKRKYNACFSGPRNSVKKRTVRFSVCHSQKLILCALLRRRKRYSFVFNGKIHIRQP